MRPIDAEAKIKEAVPAINAELMMGKLKEFSRFGLPGASMSDGRGGEPPLPLLGRTDRSVIRDRNLYGEYLSDAAVALDRAIRLQRAWCEPRDTDSEKAEKLKDVLPGKPCSNIWCHHACTGRKDDVLRNGRCPACAKYFRRSGVERPRELCDLTNAVVPATGTGGNAA